MNAHDGYNRIRAIEGTLAYAVLRGDMDWARDLAAEIAIVRDGMLNADEFLASVSGDIPAIGAAL